MATLGTTPPLPGGLPATRFFSKTYDEAHGLLVEARAYLEASSDARLRRPSQDLAHSLCLDARGENAAALPAGLRALLTRSRKLYRRIARLDEMVARDHSLV